MKKHLRNLLFFALTAISFSAFAATQDGSIPILQKGLSEALDKIFSQLQTIAVNWLAAFMLLQMVWTNWQLLLKDEAIERVFAKLGGTFFWFAICWYVFNNGPDFIKNVGSYIMRTATGTTGAVFDSTQPISVGIDVASQLLETLDSTQSVLQSLNPFPAIMMGLVACVILAVSALLAFKILMVFIETKMIIALSPINFALLGLNAFRDQGLAPLKYLVSMGIRMFLYGAVLAAMEIFSKAIIETFKNLPAASDPSVWPPIWAATLGYVILGAVALRVDSIAVVLASGSSQMSTGDAVAAGAAAGAAAGLAMSGANSIAATVANPVKSMADVIQKMASGGEGAVSNAGHFGSGRVDTGLQKPHAADAARSATSSPPAPGQPSGPGGPEFKTGSQGQPMRPEKQDDGKSSSNNDYSGNKKTQEGQKSNNSNSSGGVGSNGNKIGNNQNQQQPQWNNQGNGSNAASAGIGGTGAQQNANADAPRKEPRNDNEYRPKRSAGDHLEKLNRNIIENAGPIQVQMNTRFDID